MIACYDNVNYYDASREPADFGALLDQVAARSASRPLGRGHQRPFSRNGGSDRL